MKGVLPLSMTSLCCPALVELLRMSATSCVSFFGASLVGVEKVLSIGCTLGSTIMSQTWPGTGHGLELYMHGSALLLYRKELPRACA